MAGGATIMVFQMPSCSGSRPSVSVNERRDPPAMSVDVHSQQGEKGFVSGWWLEGEWRRGKKRKSRKQTMQETVGNKTYGERELEWRHRPASQLGEEQNSEGQLSVNIQVDQLDLLIRETVCSWRPCTAENRPTGGWQDVYPPSSKELIEITG